MSLKKQKKKYVPQSKDESSTKKTKKPKRLPKGKLKDDLKCWDESNWEKYSDEL